MLHQILLTRPSNWYTQHSILYTEIYQHKVPIFLTMPNYRNLFFLKWLEIFYYCLFLSSFKWFLYPYVPKTFGGMRQIPLCIYKCISSMKKDKLHFKYWV